MAISDQARRLFAEAFGTFVLVLAGTGAIVINQASGGAVTHVGVALTFGLVVMAMIFALGHVSGSHLNPAVTIGFWSAGRFPVSQVPAYIGSQILGAILASGLLKLLFPENLTLGATLPAGSFVQSFVLEFMLTLILMFVILSVSQQAYPHGAFAGVVIGGVIGLEAMFAGPISGASMNPARSLAPAVLSGQTESLWIYLLAPTLGALVGTVFCGCIQPAGCCGSVCSGPPSRKSC